MLYSQVPSLDICLCIYTRSILVPSRVLQNVHFEQKDTVQRELIMAEQPIARLYFLPFERLKELEAAIRAAAGIETCNNCQNMVDLDTAAILRCGDIFCTTCVGTERNVPRDQRFCPVCGGKFRSMYVVSEQGDLVRWSIGGDREKNLGRGRKGKEGDGKKEERKCVIQ